MLKDSIKSISLIIALIAIGLRLLLLSTAGYRSTDFEVHRNWLAITSSIPLSHWYKESTSIWTLDYPPLFAYFEYLISLFGTSQIGTFLFGKSSLDPAMFHVNSLDYAPIHVILFQRLSVVIVDLLVLIPGGISLSLSVKKLFESQYNTSRPSQSSYVIILSTLFTLCNVGLLIIDHIHFQYNGFLIGILFLSLSYAMNGSSLKCLFFFSILLYLKHIFIYLGLPMALFLMQDYCVIYLSQSHSFSFLRFSFLIVIFFSISIITLFPFIHQPLLSRLFPFGRGLVHSYWAPNIWTLYLSLDRVLAKVIPKLFKVTIPVSSLPIDSGKRPTSIFPNISPGISIFLVFLFGYVPLLFIMIKRETARKLSIDNKQSIHSSLSIVIRRLELPLYLALGNYVAFLFSFHVHEKAILYSTLLLSIPVYFFDSLQLKRSFFFLNLWSNFSLLPLLPYATDLFLKLSLWATYSYLEFYAFHWTVKQQRSNRSTHQLFDSDFSKFSFFEILQFFIMILLICYQSIWRQAHGFIFSDCNSFEFLPLLLTSVCATLGILFHFVFFIFQYFVSIDEFSKRTNKYY